MIVCCGGSGGNGGRSNGGGGTVAPSDYTASGVEFIKSEKPFGQGVELIKTKSGEYAYSEGKMFSGYGKAISEGKINLGGVLGEGLKFYKSRDAALSAAKKEFTRSF